MDKTKNQDPSKRLVYPVARRDDSVVDDYFGVSVPDPYRWLEDPDSKETKEWVEAQNEVTNKFFEENCSLRGELKEKLTKAYNWPKYSCTSQYGSYFYYFKNDGLQNQAVMYQQKSLDGESEVFLDPNTLSDDGTAALGNRAFTEDGSILAYAVSRSGSDWQTIYVMNALTKEKYEDKIEWVKFSGISWTHDNKGFFYCRYPSPKKLENDDAEHSETKRGTEIDSSKNQKVYYHYLGTPQENDVLVYERPDFPSWTLGVEVSDDGKYVLIYPCDGCLPANHLYYFKIENLTSFEKVSPVVVVDNFEAEYSYITNEGSLFWFRTNLKAPKSKIIQIDLENLDQANWKTIIPENEDVLNYVACVDQNKLVVVYMHHVKEILKVFDLNGNYMIDIELPDLGAIVQISGKRKSDIFFYMFSSFIYPNTIFRYDFVKGESILFRATEVPGHNPADFETKQEFYQSTDGVKIPMFIISRKNLEKNGNNGVLLYGYGGFSISLAPYFSVFRCVFIKTFNAVLAIPNIRGGAEYGEDWHTQAIIEKRQTAFNDFQCAAEYLIQQKYTNPKKICLSGGSNGGLLVTVCANQRPDLYRAIVSQVPVTDMLRFHKFTIGHAWCSDYGCSEKENEFKALYAYSPLHNIQEGKQLPAILVTTADHDDRVVPLHSFKYVATLQHTIGKTNDLPLLVRIETKAGHGAGKPTTKVIEEQADIYAFISHMLGLVSEPSQ